MGNGRHLGERELDRILRRSGAERVDLRRKRPHWLVVLAVLFSPLLCALLLTLWQLLRYAR